MNSEYERILIQQPVIPDDPCEDDFPVNLDRKCCPYKSCGNVDLYRAFGFDWHTGARVFGYKRGSNDEWYFGPVSTLAELAVKLNDREYWPVDDRDEGQQ